tara:strand:+ start:190 stop:594 length:405 start_codon:yes stop_codon:yes gene_type:complete
MKRINIHYGMGQYKNLSNLYKRPFKIRNKKTNEYVRFESVEHAYQSLKGGKFDEVTYSNPRWKQGGVKIRGRFRPNPETNIKLMEQLMRMSFKQNPKALAALKATGKDIITHNPDKTIWGKEFPRILSNLRRNL